MGAVRFTASSSERWSITSGTRLDRMSDYTWMAWIRQASTDLQHGLFTLWNDGDNYEQFGVGTLWEGAYKLFINGWGSASPGSATAGTTLSTGTWYHIACRRSGNTCAIYLNGVLDISATLANTSGGHATNTMSAGCLVNYDGSFIYYDDGRIAAVKAWQTALTEQEIRSEMRRTYPVRLADLYEFWPVANDATKPTGYAKGRTWTETNTPTYEEGPPIQWRAALPIIVVPPASAGITGTIAATLGAVTCKGYGQVGPCYIGSGSALDTTTSQTTVDISTHSSTAIGDVVIVTAWKRTSTGAWNTPTASGWTFTAIGTETAQGTTNESFWWYAVAQAAGATTITVSHSAGSAQPMLAQAHTFRQVSTQSPLDSVSPADDGYAAPTTPFTVTRTGITTEQSYSCVVAFFTAQDDTTWTSLTSGWTSAATATTSAGSDGSTGFFFKSMNGAGASGNVSANQNLAGDAGTTHIAALRAKQYAGTIAVTLGAFTASASGTVTSSTTGTIAVTLGAFVSAASGAETFTGTVAPTLGAVVSTASGTVANPVTGTIAVTLGAVTSSASGTETFTGTLASTLGAVVAAASGAETFTGTIAPTLGAVVSAASGSVTGVTAGSIAVTLGPVVSSASGTQTFTGTISRTIGPVVSTASGVETFTGTIAATLGPVVSAASGTVVQTITGAIAATLAPVVSTATGVLTVTGTTSSTLGPIVCAATGVSGADNYGPVAATIDAVICTASGMVMVETLPTIISGRLDLSATVSGVLGVSRTITGELTVSATIEGIHGSD